ncbi:hypothetical protein [Leptospira weilii]|uniref:hypothetical protein n=1 Tax=Leptospira weilii TaxID=28184 RepID=UPI0009BEB7F3|nr:hypothetical protein [Leptospira weilii]
MVVTYTGSNAGFGWYQKRQFGGMLNPSAKIVIGPVDASTIAASKIGTGGIDLPEGDGFVKGV